MVKSRRAASSCQSSAYSTVARRPSVETSRRSVVISTLPSGSTAVIVPWSIPVGIGLMPAAASRKLTSSGGSGVAQSTSAASSPSSASRTAPPTQRALPGPSAATSRARSSRVVQATAGSRSAIDQPLPREALGQVLDDRGGHSPYAVALPVDLGVFAQLAAIDGLLAHPVRRIENEPQRRLEPVRNFERVGSDCDVRRHQPEHRGDVVTGAGNEAIGRADNVYDRRAYAQFFVCLAKRGRDRVLARIELAAGKGDLAGVLAPIGRAEGEQHAGLGP